MELLDRFQAVAKQARLARAPTIDAAAAVLAKISTCSPRREETLSLAMFATLTALAASILAYFAVDDWSALSDPLAGLYPLLTLVTQ